MYDINIPTEALPVIIIVARLLCDLARDKVNNAKSNTPKSNAAKEDLKVPKQTKQSEYESEVIKVAGTRYMLVPIEGDREDVGQKKSEASNHSDWTDYLSDLADHLGDWSEELIDLLMGVL